MEDRKTMSAGVFKKVGGNLEIVKMSIPKPKQGKYKYLYTILF